MAEFSKSGWMDLTFPPESKFTPSTLQLAWCQRIHQHDVLYNFDETGFGKTLSAGIAALEVIWSLRDQPLTQKFNVLVLTTKNLNDSGKFIEEWTSNLPFGERISQVEVSTLGGKQTEKYYDLIIIDEAHNILRNNESDRKKVQKKFELMCKNNERNALESTVREFIYNPNDTISEFSILKGATYKKIRSLRCRKLLFLTATPWIDKFSFMAYHVLSKIMLQNENLSDDWMNHVNFQEKRHFLPATFLLPENQFLPVTRYFKEISNELLYRTKETQEEKNSPRRMLTERWAFSNKHSKQDAVIGKITELIENETEEKYHFILFVNYKEKEAYPLLVALSQEETLKNQVVCVTGDGTFTFDQDKYEQYEQDEASWTEKTATNEKQEEEQQEKIEKRLQQIQANIASYHSKESEGLPRVLIVTYKMAEEGVDLPGFNYVVNYHIPTNPIQTEQRFGRVDRQSSLQKKVTMAYVLKVKEDGNLDPWDVNTKNFIQNSSTFFQSLISHIPCKNTLMSKAMLEEYTKFKENNFRTSGEFLQVIDGKYWEKKSVSDLLDFCQGKLSENPIIEHLKTRNGEEMVTPLVSDVRTSYNAMVQAESTFRQFKMLRDIENCIFYCEFSQCGEEFHQQHTDSIPRNITLLSSSPQDCATAILEQGAYAQYHQYCQHKLEKNNFFPEKDQKCRQLINDYFVERFLDNDFEHLFPTSGYQEVFYDILSNGELREILENFPEEKEYFLVNHNNILENLPFFQFLDTISFEWADKLCPNSVFSERGDREKEGGFIGSFKQLFFSQFIRPFFITFCQEYTKNEAENMDRQELQQSTAVLLFKKENGNIQATPWLRLLLHLYVTEFKKQKDKKGHFAVLPKPVTWIFFSGDNYEKRRIPATDELFHPEDESITDAELREYLNTFERHLISYTTEKTE